ncbi:MAG TPA: ATP-binding protein, partial [Candidatus Treponema faecavium]|nr:ATP-binding protein [Candidatus Treponema faecavium]
SIFSDLNQLRDISLEKDYASICGITQAELEANFGPEIDALAQENGITYAECVNRLREMYDGYKFHGNGEPLYNPFSVMNAFASREFGSYWFRTGTPTILIKKLEQTKYDVRKLSLDDVRISAAEMSDYRPDSQNPIPLFYQTGYLTIKRYDAEYRKYLLGYPNEEVKYAFLESLVPMLTDGLELDADFSIVDFNEAVKAGDTDTMRDWFTALFAKLPYMAAGGEKLDAVIEQNFQNVIYIVFILLGQYAQVEQHSVFGRADCIVQNKNCVYIFEFKRDDTAENALKQIEEKKYTEQFAGDKRRLFKIGVSFSTKERGIAEWKAIEG